MSAKKGFVPDSIQFQLGAIVSTPPFEIYEAPERSLIVAGELETLSVRIFCPTARRFATVDNLPGLPTSSERDERRWGLALLARHGSARNALWGPRQICYIDGAVILVSGLVQPVDMSDGLFVGTDVNEFAR